MARVDAELQGLLIIILRLLKKPVYIGNAIGAGQALETGTFVLVKARWDHRDITSNVIAYKHLHR